MAASGAVALAGAAVAQLRKEENAPSALGWSGPKLGRELVRLREFPWKQPGLSWWIGPNWQWAMVNYFHNFQTKIWVLKSSISNFKPKLNWGQTRINSNKLFEYFSNLQLLKKLALNVQI
jgi:hypothetical protein